MPAAYRRPSTVALVRPGERGTIDDGTAYLAVLPGGPIRGLDPVGYLIWCAAVDLGDQDRVIGEVASVTGAERDEIAADVAAFLTTMVEQRLLEPR